jgi:hypothetical protein
LGLNLIDAALFLQGGLLREFEEQHGSITRVLKLTNILTAQAWKRYRIKDSERGHRTSLSKTFKEPTARLDTSIILPQRVYNWLGTKPNKAAFIREIMIKSYEKTAHWKKSKWLRLRRKEENI